MQKVTKKQKLNTFLHRQKENGLGEKALSVSAAFLSMGHR